MIILVCPGCGWSCTVSEPCRVDPLDVVIDCRCGATMIDAQAFNEFVSKQADRATIECVLKGIEP